MKKQIITCDVPEDLVTKMCKLKYEMSARENILAFLLLQDVPVTDNKNFETYQAEYVEMNARYSSLKKELETQYVLPKTEGRKANWKLDFDTSILTIEVE